MLFIGFDSWEEMPKLSCLKFLFLLRDEKDTGPLAGGWRWSVIRAHFVLYIYCFVYINGCIATPVVRQRAFHAKGVGSSPSAAIFPHFFIFFLFLSHNRCAGPQQLGLVIFASLPPSWLFLTPLAQFYFLFLIFILFIFLIIFLILKKS